MTIAMLAFTSINFSCIMNKLALQKHQRGGQQFEEK